MKLIGPKFDLGDQKNNMRILNFDPFGLFGAGPEMEPLTKIFQQIKYKGP